MKKNYFLRKGVRNSLSLFWLVCFGQSGFGQIYNNSFTGASSCPTTGNIPSMAVNSTGTSVTRNTVTCQSTANVFNSTTLNNTSSLSPTSHIEFSATAVTGYKLNLTSLTFFRQASASAPNQLEVRFSTDGFSTFTTWGAAPNSPTSGSVATWDFSDFSTLNAGTVTFRLYPFGTQRADNTASSTTGTFRVDDITINGTVTSINPTVITTGTLSSINTTFGTASNSPTSFSVSGSNLTNDILITPPTSFEVSRTSGGSSGYADTQTLTETAGVVNATTIYVRLKATASVVGSPYSGDIVLSSAGATSVNVPTVSSTVTPKNLTVTGLTANNKVYDRDNTATLSGTASYVGLENGETFAVTGTPIATFSDALKGDAKTLTVIGFTAPSTNYTVTQPTGLTANITAKALTVSGAMAANKVYDGNTNATINDAMLDGVISPDKVTFSGNSAFDNPLVADAIPITTALVLGGADAANYYIVQPTGLTADITRKGLTILNLSANNKVYDGNTNASLTGPATLVGVISGDVAEVVLGGSPTATFASSAVGTGIAVTVSGYLLTGAKVGNYSLTQPSGLTADITTLPTPLISSSLTATATYGEAAATYTITASDSPTSFNASGLPDGLSINTTTGEITGIPTNPAGSPFSVTISATNLGGTGNATLIYTINKKELVVNSTTAQNKEYDRTDAATISGTLGGVIGLDDVSFLGTGTFAQATFGDGISVTSTATLGGADAAKYTLIQPAGLTANITKKSLTVSGASASNKVYNGNTAAVINGATLVGVINPDVVNISGNGLFALADVADNIAVTTSLVLGGAAADNYSLTQPIGLIANITPAPLIISGLSASNKEYDRTTNATLTGIPVLNGIINSDDVSITGAGIAAFTNMNIGTAIPITVSGYTLSGAKAGNYSLQPTITADITPKALTITGAVAQNKNFDGNTNALITGTLTGVISPDVVTFSGTGTFASSAVGNGIAVTAAITLGGAGASNYIITQPTGLTANILTPQFTASHLVVVNVNNTNSVGLLEYSNSGSLLQTFNIPSTGSDALTISYSSTSEGALSRTSSGYYLGLVGYRTGTNASLTDRVIARVNNFGVINTKSVIPNSEGYTGNNIRSAVFNDDGSRFWAAGTGGISGVRTNIFEATSGSTQLSTTITNTRILGIFNNQLYVTSSTGAFQGINTVGIGLPTNTGNSISLLPGFPTTSGPSSYGFSINSNNSIAYVADDRASALGGIQKWTFNGSVWALSYTLGTGVTNIGARGLTVDWSGSNPIIYATTAEGSLNRIIKIEDTGVSSSPTTLATSATNNIFRGIAFAPILAPPTVNLSVSANAGTEAGSTVITATATSTSAVSGDKTVSIAVSGTNITAGDYILSNTTIIIPDGQTTGTVTFTIVDDAELESNETATLTISNPSSGLTLGAVTTQNVVITDNDNTAPSILIDANTTNNYIDGGVLSNISSSFATSGVINDPTDPALNFGIDFVINDAESAVGGLIVTATSSNQAVVSNANLNLTGSGANRNLKITPFAVGFSIITLSVNDGITTTNFILNYGASQASINPSTSRFHSGKSDASTAIFVDSDLMLVADDEDQFIRLYNRSNSGLPINAFDFTSALGLTDPNNVTPREVDIEASMKVSNDIYWMGSESNSSGGSNRPNRNRVFKTALSGTGTSTTLSYVSRYDFLKEDILAWDANNIHGKGADYYGLVASATAGVIPESSTLNGFNIEGIEMAPDNTTAYIAFRAPQVIPADRKKALIIPVSNFTTILTPTGGTIGSATFGSPIEINLGGRGIREIRKNAANEYLIIAGPADAATGVAPKDFKFFTWTGNPADEPVKRSYNLASLSADGSFESIVELPASLNSSSNLQILVDNGDAVFYADGTIAKELSQANHKKFRSELVSLSAPSLAVGTISGTSFCIGSALNVPFTFTNEIFNNGNVFTAQLSDENGSFVNPVAIGTLTDINAGTITAMIPINAIAGSNYRIRIVSSNSEITGGDNGSNLTINSIPSKPSITPATTSICTGVSTTLTASACDGGTLNWTGGLTGSSVTVSPASTRMYKVACTISGCTSDSSDATTVTVNQKPAKPSITPTNTTICTEVSSTLTANACDGGTLNWTGGLTGSSVTVSPASTRMYKVACTISGCTSDSSDATTVTVNQKPVKPSITPASTTICAGASTTLNASACDGGTLNWTGGLTGVSVTVSPASTRMYKVACTISGCTSDSSDAITVTVNPKPAKPSITPANTTICPGVSSTLTANACDGGTLNWTGGLTGLSLTVSPASTRMYKVACTISGCTSDSSDATTVTVNQKPAAPIATATPSIITVGQTSSLSATGCDGGTITWLFNNSNANPLNVSPSSTTTYSATCTLNGCVSNISNAVTVTVNSTGPCQSNVTLSSTADDYPSGIQLKQANSSNGTIQATNKITGSAIVTYQAKSIELSPGFKADNGTVFKAEIGGCN